MFTSIKNLHVCSEHYETEQIVKTLSGIKRLAYGTVQQYFCMQFEEVQINAVKGRMRGENKKLAMTAWTNFPPKFRVSTDISLKDHDYVPKEKKVHKEEAFKEKE